MSIAAISEQLRRHRSLWLTGVVLVWLAGCETVGGPGRTSGVRATDADREFLDANYSQAASLYEQVAARGTELAPSTAQLMAAMAWQLAGQPERGQRWINAASPEALSTGLGQLASAGAALAINDRETANAALDQAQAAELNTLERLSYQAFRAQALFLDGQPQLATSHLTRRELWLSSERAITANHQMIWNGLRATDPQKLREAANATSDPVVKGWLDLVIDTSRSLRSPDRLARVVEQWTQRYPSHPGNAYFVPALLASSDGEATSLRQAALLLPLSGRTQSVAAAIRDGFLAAHFERGNPEIAIRVYDIADGGPILSYQTAVDEGADIVVGPLTKNALREITLLPELSVPVLGLNRLADDELVPAGIYQFALAPEDEASVAAERAVAAGLPRAIALAPLGDWGERVLAAFASSLSNSGGVLLDFERYDPTSTDFSPQIERVMQISASVARRRQLRALLGEPLQYEPRRRQDVDVIFIAANAANARAIKPQLKFHYSGDIPVYATSAVSAAETRNRADLRGIEFPEIPWLVAPDIAPRPALDTMNRYWRSQLQLNRLRAMGIDAYDLMADIFEPQAQARDGATGRLTLADDGRVYRSLPWVRYEGNDVVLQDALAPAIPDSSAWPAAEERGASE